MEEVFYKKTIKCPICENEFITTKLKTKAIRVKDKDEDFCTYYETHNPIFYEIFICPSCGYAASERNFTNINNKEKTILMKAFANRQVERDFGNVRNHKDALDSFKLALYTEKLKQGKNSTIAGLALKIAWLYRYIDDANEYKFLKLALEHYKRAFDQERLVAGEGMDEVTVIYLVGEIARRLNNYDESLDWFNRLVNHPMKHTNKRLEKLAREQWRKVRDDKNTQESKK